MPLPPPLLHRLLPFRLCLGACVISLLCSGCAAMPGSGASRMQVQRAESAKSLEGITILDVDDTLARKLTESKKQDVFSEIFAGSKLPNYRVGPGDIIEISVWESPPNMLFGGISLDSKTGAVSTRPETLPPQMVMEDGKITMPFVGRVRVSGRAVYEIEADIIERLQGQANHPQVMVRATQSPTSYVTIIGDVSKSARMRLTPKGERLLDALAEAGGVSQPVTRMALQLTRSSTTATMPLDVVIRDPKQNIFLLPGDVLTALFQPQNFTVFGATGKNAEVPFEAQGISLAQALARAGGLNDNRADAKGVFVFRYESAALLPVKDKTPQAMKGLVPVVYQVNFEDPTAFFVTQNFPMQNNDVIYVSNAPSAELEKFLRMIGLVLTPTLNITRQAQIMTQ